jgi:hypothetical protein
VRQGQIWDGGDNLVEHLGSTAEVAYRKRG